LPSCQRTQLKIPTTPSPPFLRGEIYWGHRLKHVEDPGDGGIQDDGVTFALVASF
jgi:hypothetical protein